MDSIVTLRTLHLFLHLLGATTRLTYCPI